MLGVLEGERLTFHELHRFAHRPLPMPSGLHWNITGIFNELITGVRVAAQWCREHDVPLGSIGVDTWGVDCGLLSRTGELLALPRAYRDARHQRGFDDLLQRIGVETIYGTTGIQQLPFNTLYQLRAMRMSEPELLDQAAALLWMPDLCQYFLSGMIAVEFCIASTSQMLDARTCTWATDLLAKADLPTHFLQPLHPPATVRGGLRREIAEIAGITGDVRIVSPASHDTASAVVAIPADAGVSWCFLSSGTWSIIGAELPEPFISAAGRTASFANEGGINNTSRFLKNIAGLWIVQEYRRELELDGASITYDSLAQQAAAAAPFRTLINTEDPIFSAPGRMAGRIASFAQRTGQPEPATPGQFARCCLESLALAYRRTLRQLEQVLGREFDVLHAVGGGARNTLLNQMTADAIARPVIVGPYEATAAGNVLVQALGMGEVRDLNQIRRISAASFERQTVTPRETGAWDKAEVRLMEAINA